VKWVPKDQTGEKSREVRIQAEGPELAQGGTTSWAKQRMAGGNNGSIK